MTIIILSLFFVIVLYLIIYAYIKITYKFWSYQPVFHIYNLFYWCFPPGIIEHSLPVKNKFVNQENIKTYDEITDSMYNEALSLIQTNYYRTNKCKFNPMIENFKNYFVGHFDKSFFSFYYKNKFIENNDTFIDDKEPVGFMSSRPLHVYIDNHFIDVYYVDYLCVEKKMRKKGIAPDIIQTHIYNSRRSNKNIHVQLFKREADLTGIVPITIYYNYIFEIIKWKKPKNNNPNFKTFQISNNNFYLIHELIKENLIKYFKIFAVPEYSNIIQLISTENIFIYCSTLGDKIIGFYFFRNTCTEFKNFNTYECFSSICFYSNLQSYFVSGFHNAVFNIFKINNFKYLILENISHNNIIIKKIIESKVPVRVYPSAFYFYNFGYTPFLPNSFFAIY